MRDLRCSQAAPLRLRGDSPWRLSSRSGLQKGGDDYMVKPYSVSELMARIRTQLRRTRPVSVGERLEYDDIVLDSETHRVTRAGEPVRLTRTEFNLLAILAQNPDSPGSLGIAISEAVEADEPFYLYMSHYAVHAPFNSDPRFADHYADSDKPAPAQAFATLRRDRHAAPRLDRKGRRTQKKLLPFRANDRSSR